MTSELINDQLVCRNCSGSISSYRKGLCSHCERKEKMVVVATVIVLAGLFVGLCCLGLVE